MVRAETVSSAIMSIGKMIALEFKHNPFKIVWSNKFHPRIVETLDSWWKTDPTT